MLRSLVALVIAIAAMPATAAVLTGPVVNPANGNSYYLLDATTWTASQTEAESLGGNLTTINDGVENNWVFDTFANFDSQERNLWIGYTDQDVEGSFEWIDGSVSTYTNWAPGEPSNGGLTMNEDFAYITGLTGFGPRMWNDVSNGAAGGILPYGVVEVPIPEPTSVALVFAGLCVFRVRRR